MASDKMYLHIIEVKEKRLKCACEGCNNVANPGNQVQGSFLAGSDLKSEIDLTYNRVARNVTLYLCNECHQKVVNPPLSYPLVEHTQDEVKRLHPGEFFLDINKSPCICVNCQNRRMYQ